MSNPILNIQRGGHQLYLDEREGYFRVCCNGAVAATFNTTIPGGVIAALKHAVEHAEGMEAKCFEHPKPGFEV